MLFTPLRKAVIAGAGVVALGAGAGVGVHSALSANLTSATTTASTAAATPTPGTSPNPNACPPRGPKLGAAEQVLSITASVTGQTRQQILDQLRAGKTLDQIAGDKASIVEQQAIDKLKTALDKRVSAGKLTAAQEQSMLDKAKSTLDTAMSSNLSDKIPAAGSAAECAPRGLLGMVVKVTADKTGMTVQQVLDQLKAGKSIDQIAGSKAADVKATVLQMEQQRLSSALDKLMGRSGLPTPHDGHGKGAPSPAPSPAASPSA